MDADIEEKVTALPKKRDGSARPFLFAATEKAALIAPDFHESRTVRLSQIVKLADVPEGAKNVKLWIPVPTDRNWQRVLDLTVKDAPGEWEFVPQEDGHGTFLFVEVNDPKPGEMAVTIECLVTREGVHFPLGQVKSLPSFQTELFKESLDLAAPLMLADETVQKLASEACGNEADIAKQAVMLVHKVAEVADHYSKDPTKPHCGRGSAQDCLVNGSGIGKSKLIDSAKGDPLAEFRRGAGSLRRVGRVGPSIVGGRTAQRTRDWRPATMTHPFRVIIAISGKGLSPRASTRRPRD